MSSIRRVYPTPCWLTRRIIRCLDQVWIPTNGNDQYSCQLVRRSMKPTSDHPVQQRENPAEKYALWYIIRQFVRRLNSIASDNPVPWQIFRPWKHAVCRILWLKIRPGIFIGSDNSASLTCLSDLTYSDYPNQQRISCISFLTWSWFELYFFLLPSVFLSFLGCLELIFEQVCMKSKANYMNDQATHLEPP